MNSQLVEFIAAFRKTWQWQETVCEEILGSHLHSSKHKCVIYFIKK